MQFCFFFKFFLAFCNVILLCLHCWVPKSTLRHVSPSKYCSMPQFDFIGYKSDQTKRLSSILSNHTKKAFNSWECLLVHAVTCWMPVLQWSPQSPFFVSVFFSLAGVCFLPVMFVHSLAGVWVIHILFCLAYENEQILKIFFPRQVKRWMWNPSNDGFASCFFMIGGVGSTYFAVEKVLSHISHHCTLCNYIYV